MSPKNYTQKRKVLPMENNESLYLKFGQTKNIGEKGDVKEDSEKLDFALLSRL
jgi:hypothetical protein